MILPMILGFQISGCGRKIAVSKLESGVPVNSTSPVESPATPAPWAFLERESFCVSLIPGYGAGYATTRIYTDGSFTRQGNYPLGTTLDGILSEATKIQLAALVDAYIKSLGASEECIEDQVVMDFYSYALSASLIDENGNPTASKLLSYKTDGNLYICQIGDKALLEQIDAIAATVQWTCPQIAGHGDGNP